MATDLVLFVINIFASTFKNSKADLLLKGAWIQDSSQINTNEKLQRPRIQ